MAKSKLGIGDLLAFWQVSVVHWKRQLRKSNNCYICGLTLIFVILIPFTHINNPKNALLVSELGFIKNVNRNQFLPSKPYSCINNIANLF
jgi:hypothetical protein